jgi:hypothetical protein
MSPDNKAIKTGSIKTRHRLGPTKTGRLPTLFMVELIEGTTPASCPSEIAWGPPAGNEAW